MKYFVITDSTDTQVGLRLAGIEGVVVREEPLVRAAIQTAAADPDIACCSSPKSWPPCARISSPR